MFVQRSWHYSQDTLFCKSEDSVIDTLLDTDACLQNIEDKDIFLFFLNYRGNPSDYFVKFPFFHRILSSEYR